MALSFPSNPSNGDTVTAGDITWTFNSSKGVWQNNVIGLSGASISIAADSGSTDNVTLGEDTLTIAGGTGLTSTVSDNQVSVALDNTSVSAGTYGSGSSIPRITVDSQGRITSATAVNNVPTAEIGMESVVLDASNITNGTAYGIKSLGNTDFASLGAQSVNISATSNPQLVETREYIITSLGTTAAATTTSNTKVYKIVSVGNTDFTAIGASANTVGVGFTATGAGSGTGTVVEITNWIILGAGSESTPPSVGDRFRARGTGNASYGTGTVLETLFTANGTGSGTGTVALDTTHFITFVDSTTGTSKILSEPGLQYNPGKGTIFASNLDGQFTGRFEGTFKGSFDSTTTIGQSDAALTVTVTQHDTASVPSGDNLFFVGIEDAVSGTGRTLKADTRIYYDDTNDKLVTNALDVSGNVTIGGNLDVTGDLTLSGDLTFGDNITDKLTFTGAIDSNFIPDDDGIFDLGSSSKEWKDIYIDGVAYIDTLSLDGTALTATAAELNILDGVTSTTAELNILGGVTATTAELNILDGVTSSTAELNILDGVTASAADINLIDGITNGTVIASKAIVTDANKDISGGRNITITGALATGTLSINSAAVTSTAAELNILDGVTATTAELNILDGVTATTAELNTLGGVTATTAELNILDGVTATTAELNLLDGITEIDTDLSSVSSNDDTLASAKAIAAYVNSQVTAQDLDFAGDSGGAQSVELNTETLTIAGGTGLTTAGSGQTLTINLASASGGGITVNADDIQVDNTVVRTSGAQTIAGDKTFSNNIEIQGNLTVGGTTTTINSTVVSVADPVFEIGDDSSDDNLDRGIKFKYNAGGAKVGFFGFDDSTSKFIAIKDATDSSSVFSGTALDAVFGSIDTTSLTGTVGITAGTGGLILRHSNNDVVLRTTQGGNFLNLPVFYGNISNQDGTTVALSVNTGDAQGTIPFLDGRSARTTQIAQGTALESSDTSRKILFEGTGSTTEDATFANSTSSTFKTVETDSNNLTFNPSTHTLTVDNVAGNVTGNLTGIATKSTKAAVTETGTTNSEFPVIFGDATAETVSSVDYHGLRKDVSVSGDINAFTYNPSTGALRATSFIGNISGSSSVASQVDVSVQDSSSDNHFITFVDGTSSAQGIEVDSNLKYVPSTEALTVGGALTAGSFVKSGGAATSFLMADGTTVDISSGKYNIAISGNADTATTASSLGNLSIVGTSATSVPLLLSENGTTRVSDTSKLKYDASQAELYVDNLTIDDDFMLTAGATFLQASNGTFTVGSPATFTHNLNVGESGGTQRYIQIHAHLNSDFIPGATNVRSLGSSSLKWANVHSTTFTGNLTGNVTGNITGNVTGNTAGTHTGPVSFSGASSFASSSTLDFANVTISNLTPDDLDDSSSTNQFYTDEKVDDRLNALISTSNSGLSKTYNDNANSLTLAIDLNGLTAADIDSSQDSIAFIDATNNGSRKESIADFATNFVNGANSALTASSGKLSLNLDGLASEVLSVPNDSIVFIDADGSASKKESVADFVDAIAGTNLTQDGTNKTLGILNETIEDIVGAMFTDSFVSYNDTAGSITISQNTSSGVNLTGSTDNTNHFILLSDGQTGASTIRTDAILRFDTTDDTLNVPKLDIDNNLHLDGATISSNVVPSANNQHDLGSTSSKWKDLHIAGNVNFGNLNDGTNSVGSFVTSVANASNTTVPTEGAVKSYVDNATSGTVTGITGGSAITASGSGTITIDLDLGELGAMSAAAVSSDKLVVLDTSNSNLEATKTFSDISLSLFDNSTSGFTTNAGTVTSVAAGTGLSISGTASTTPTVNLNLHSNGTLTADSNGLRATLDLNELGDVSTSGATSGQFLSYNGSSYVFASPPSVATATTSVKGIASFSDNDFTVTNGEVTLDHVFTGTAGTFGTDGSASSDFIGSLTIDAEGRITAVNTQSLPTNLVVDGDFSSAGIMATNGSGTYSIITDNSSNWNAAYTLAGTTSSFNSAVDTHLNQSNPTSGYVLSWNGSDYAWIQRFVDADIDDHITVSSGLSYDGGLIGIDFNKVLRIDNTDAQTINGVKTFSATPVFSSNVTIGGTTASTSTTTGALTVAGGVGIAGATNIAGNLNVDGTLTISGGTTSISTTNLSVTDPLIELASGNTLNAADIGLFGGYNKTNAQSFTGVTQASTSGSGSNAAFTINKSGGSYTSVSITTSGSGYAANDTITISGANLGGTSTTNDATITVTTVDGSGSIVAASIAGTASTGTQLYAGLFRDASDNKWKFFEDSQTNPGTSTTIASGFTKSKVVADLEGTADVASTVAVAANNTESGTFYLPFVSSQSGNLDLETDNQLHYNPSTGRLTAGNIQGTFIGNLTGNVTGNITGNITGGLTGNVSGNAGTATALQTAVAFIIKDTSHAFDGTQSPNLTDAIGTLFPSNKQLGTTISYDSTDEDFDVTTTSLYNGTTKKLEATSTDVEVTAHFVPATHDTYDLGTSSKRFRKIFVEEGQFAANTITVGTKTISADSDGIIVSGDLTATNLTGSLTGNVTGSADTLTTARNFTVGSIDHSFNGSANIDLTEAIQDAVAAMFTHSNHTSVTASYDDTNGEIDLTASGGGDGGSGSSVTWTIKTASYTASAEDQIIVNGSGAVTITLPSSPSAGEWVKIKNISSSTTTVGRNSSNIDSSAQDGTVAAGRFVELVYVNSTIGWVEI